MFTLHQIKAKNPLRETKYYLIFHKYRQKEMKNFGLIILNLDQSILGYIYPVSNAAI